MQKMRVSPMRIIKHDGKNQEIPPPQRTRQQRDSLKDRLSRIEYRWRKQREEGVAYKKAARTPIVRALRSSYARNARKNAKQQEPTTAARWRRDVALQAGICAVILVSALGFRFIDTPVTNRVTDGLEKAVTMEIDISDNLGELQFVRNALPESVLVFWSKTADAPTELYAPMNGEIAVRYSAELPGILIIGDEQAVYAAADGEVLSVTRGEEGDFILRIRHDGGVETLYGLLQGVKVAPGERVRIGQEVALGMPTSGGAQLYFQAFADDAPIDPEPMFQR